MSNATIENALQPPPAAERPELTQFKTNLLKAMHEKSINASDLARGIWGETTDKRGYTVARNRDRITQYLAGRSYPDPQNLLRMAETLDVPVEYLSLQQPTPHQTRRRVFLSHSAGPSGALSATATPAVTLTLHPNGRADLAFRRDGIPREFAMHIIDVLNALDSGRPLPGDTVQ